MRCQYRGASDEHESNIATQDEEIWRASNAVCKIRSSSSISYSAYLKVFDHVTQLDAYTCMYVKHPTSHFSY